MASILGAAVFELLSKSCIQEIEKAPTNAYCLERESEDADPDGMALLSTLPYSIACPD